MTSQDNFVSALLKSSKDAHNLPPEVLKVSRNIMLNTAVGGVDEIIKNLPPATQMGVLMVAQAVCFRRLMRVMGIKNNGQKHVYLKAALKDFELKIRDLGYAEPREPTPREQADEIIRSGANIGVDKLPPGVSE